MKRSELIDKLENEYNFRDYRILPARYYRKISRQGIHHLFSENASNDLALVDYEIEDCLNVFLRNGFGTIYFYI